MLSTVRDKEFREVRSIHNVMSRAFRCGLIPTKDLTKLPTSILPVSVFVTCLIRDLVRVATVQYSV